MTMSIAVSCRIPERAVVAVPRCRASVGTSTPQHRLRNTTTVYAAKRTAPKSDPLRKGRGYIKEDNSGKANVFGTVPDQLYVKSPTADKISQSGIGGLQGITVLGVALAAVLVITTGVLRFEDGDNLRAVRVVFNPAGHAVNTVDTSCTQVAQLPQADTLTAMAQRLKE